MVLSAGDPDMVTLNELEEAVGAERGTPEFIAATQNAHCTGLRDNRNKLLYYFIGSEEPNNTNCT